MISTLTGLATGIGSALVCIGETSGEMPWWAYLLISISGAIVGLICDLVKDILENKKIITKEQGDKMQERYEDFLDDGKMNGSSKKEDKNNEKDDRPRKDK